MRCPTCDTKNAIDARFCKRCGSRVASVCSGCDTINTTDAAYCMHCGSPLATISQLPAHMRPAVSIVQGRDLSIEELRHLTVLFADVSGSYAIISDKSPEEAGRLIDPAVDRMAAICRQYGGTVVRKMGDGILAFFGAPQASETHASQACFAALAMRHALELQRSSDSEDTPPFPMIHVGVHSGEVMLRIVNTDLGVQYDAVGPVVHLASRLMELAKPGQIIVSQEVCALAGGHIGTHELESQTIRGAAQEIRLFELRSGDMSNPRSRGFASTGSQRLIGRAEEWAALQASADAVERGQGQVHAVVGEPGIGKSRLTTEFARHLAELGWLMLHAESPSVGPLGPYCLFAGLLRSYLQISGQTESGEIRALVQRAVGSLGIPEPELSSAALTWLLGVEPDPAVWEPVRPNERPGRVQAALRGLLYAEARRQPVVVLLEDLQRLDKFSQSVLDDLYGHLPDGRVLHLLNYRPEYQHGWSKQRYYAEMRLQPLSPDDMTDLVNVLMGSSNSGKQFSREIALRSGGNPLFAEEIVKHAQRPQSSPDELTIPDSVFAVIENRIDQLDRDAKYLLQAAAVLGEQMPLDLIDAIAHDADALGHLKDCEFLSEFAQSGEPMLRFGHVLIRDVAYNTLPSRQKLRMHAKVAEALRQSGQRATVDIAAMLAYHSYAAEDWPNAANYARQAGVNALSNSAWEDAEQYLSNALNALERLPQDRDNRSASVDVRFEMRNALVEQGQMGRATEMLKLAQELSQDLEDPVRLCRTNTYLAHSCWATGNNTAAIGYGEAATSLARDLRRPDLLATSSLFLGLSYMIASDFDRANEALLCAVDSISAEAVNYRFGYVVPPSVLARSYVCRTLMEVGAVDDGLRLAREGIALSEELRDPKPLVFALMGSGCAKLTMGDVEGAYKDLSLAYDKLGEAAMPFLSPIVGMFLGSASTQIGHPARGADILRKAVDDANAMGIQVQHTLRTLFLSQAMTEMGRLGEAERLAEEAIELAEQADESGPLAYALLHKGIVGERLKRTGNGAGEASIRHALDLAGSLKMRPLVGKCHYALARMLSGSARAGEAMDELERADRMFGELAMYAWQERAGRLRTNLDRGVAGAEPNAPITVY